MTQYKKAAALLYRRFYRHYALPSFDALHCKKDGLALGISGEISDRSCSSCSGIVEERDKHS